ncbi:hypothetical protein ACRRTK_003671 [Alexandromys fortis]
MHGMTMCRYLNHRPELNGKECAHHRIKAGGNPMRTEVYLTSGSGRAMETGVHFISGSFYLPPPLGSLENPLAPSSDK